MIIDVTGFGWSGSGAVIDILKEYQDVEHPAIGGWEFNLLHCVDGIYDLDWKLNNKHCRFLDSNVALKRFLHLVNEYEARDSYRYKKIFNGEFIKWCQEYVDNLTDVKFQAKSAFDRIYFPPNAFLTWLSEKFLGYGKLKWFGAKVVDKDIDRTKIFAYNVEDFYGKTHQFTNKIMAALRKDPNKPLVMDHMFSPDCPHLFFKYIDEDVKCIIVRRDPRDTYLLAKHVYKDRIPLPTDNVEDFITFYKKSVEATMIENSSTILNVQFEDLIYYYDDSIKKIENFVGISNHSNMKKYFNPSISVNNTCLYKSYPEYSIDIRKIEEYLPHSLYPFEKCEKVKSIRYKVF